MSLFLFSSQSVCFNSGIKIKRNKVVRLNQIFIKILCIAIDLMCMALLLEHFQPDSNTFYLRNCYIEAQYRKSMHWHL